MKQQMLERKMAEAHTLVNKAKFNIEYSLLMDRVGRTDEASPSMKDGLAKLDEAMALLCKEDAPVKADSPWPNDRTLTSEKRLPDGTRCQCGEGVLRQHEGKGTYCTNCGDQWA